jgi:predicted PurR-regulated permease PerM
MSDNRLDQRTAMVALTVLAAGCAVVLLPFLSALLWAIILSFSTWPIYSRLEKLLGGRPTLAALAMIIVVAMFLVLPILIVAVSLADNVSALAAAFRRVLAEGPPAPPNWILDVPLVGHRLFERWQSVAADGAKFSATLQPYVGDAANWILGLGASAGASIAQLALSLFIAFFLYRDGASAVMRLRVAAERLAGNRGQALLTVAGSTIKGIVYGVLGTNLVQGVLAGFGFWLSGVPGAFLLGLLSFFLTTIPTAPLIVWVPAVLWLFHNGDTGWTIFLAIWSILVFGPLENILRPYLISRGSDLPLVMVFLGMIGGLLAFGLLGIFLGPVLLAIGFSLVEEWCSSQHAAVAPPVEAGR